MGTPTTNVTLTRATIQSTFVTLHKFARAVLAQAAQQRGAGIVTTTSRVGRSTKPSAQWRLRAQMTLALPTQRQDAICSAQALVSVTWSPTCNTVSGRRSVLVIFLENASVTTSSWRKG